MIVHHGNTLFNKYSWKEITKKYRERASGFPFAAREIISRMENNAMNSQQKSTLPHTVAIRGCQVPGWTCFFRTWMSPAAERWKRAQKAWEARGTSSGHSLPGTSTGTVQLAIFWTQTISSRVSGSGALLRAHFRRLIFTQTLGKGRKFS